MHQALAVFMLAGCYLLIGLGLARCLLVWRDWRDARATNDFYMQCVIAEALQERIRKRRANEREWGRAA